MGIILLMELDQEKSMQDFPHGKIKLGDVPEWTRINVGMESSRELIPALL